MSVTGLMKRVRFLGTLLTLALIISLLPTAVLADQPSPPHRFYGTVTSAEGGDPAPDGLLVTVWIDGEEVASCITKGGWYGNVEIGGEPLDVFGDPGDLVSFQVRGVEMEGQTAMWERGTVTRLDFTVAFVNETTTVDTAAPVIYDMLVSGIGTSQATISWNTNELATSQVEYGKTTAYGKTSDLSTVLTTEHRVELTGLKFRTEYHFRVKSADDVGNEAVSADNTFTTSTPVWFYAVVGVGALVILAIVLAVVVWIVRRLLG